LRVEASQKTMNDQVKATDLIKQQRDITFPFTLHLQDQMTSFTATQPLRIVPNKRLVVWGYWQSQSVVAKLFFTKKAKRYAQQEIRGIKALQASHIRTPKLYYHGLTNDDSIYILLFEAIQQAQDIYSLILSEGETTVSREVQSSVIACLAAQHQAGLMQSDLHPQNFLWTNHTLFTIDGSSIQSVTNPLEMSSSLRNLALLFAQFPPSFDAKTIALLHDYASYRSIPLTVKHLETFKSHLNIQRKQRIQFCLKKIMRNCTDFSLSKTFTKRFVCRRNNLTPAMNTLLMNIDAAFTDTTPIKAGRSSTVILHTLEDKTVVIKRYNIKSFFHYLKRCLQPTRAACAWQNAHRLQLLNVSTPQPIAFVERRLGPLRSTSYFISEFIPGESLIHLAQQHIKMKHDNKSVLPHSLKPVLNAVQSMLQQLWQQGISHGDLKASNIIINNNKPYLIDLDALRTHRSARTFTHHLQKDYQRFLANWKTFPHLNHLFKDMLIKQGEKNLWT